MNYLEILFHGIGGTIQDVTIAILPILVIFLILQFRALHLHKRQFNRIISGMVIFYIGLVLFLQGVHVAFLPVGEFLGHELANMENNWLLIPLGFLMGLLVACAEPAVHVMIKQVEELSSGTIKSTVMLAAISLGVASAVALGMAKLLYGLSLWGILIPGYIIVFILSKFVDNTFIGMAFDNGGVATGPMCSTFILAMSLSIAGALEHTDAILDGFGIVALIALAPIITTMLLSFVYQRRDARRDMVEGEVSCSEMEGQTEEIITGETASSNVDIAGEEM